MKQQMIKNKRMSADGNPRSVEPRQKSNHRTGTTRRQVLSGNHSVLAARGVSVQPKLAVSAPGDKYEREADRMAEAVMRMPAPKPSATLDENGPPSAEASTSTDTIQRLCPRCRERHEQGKPLNCPSCENELQRKEAPGDGTPALNADTQQRIESLRGGGRLLPMSVRSFFEPRFGYDFSDVRVHTGTKADEAARSIDAEAFTLGSDVVLRDGKFQPDTSEGKKLLAHELTHVHQQEMPNRPRIQRQMTAGARGKSIARPRKSERLSHQELWGGEGQSTTHPRKLDPEDKQARDILISMGMDSDKAKRLVGAVIVRPEVSAARRLARLNNKIMTNKDIATYFAVEHLVRNASLRIPEGYSLSGIGDIQYADYELVVPGLGAIDGSVDKGDFKPNVPKFIKILKGRFIAHARSWIIKEGLGSVFAALVTSAVLMSYKGLKTVFNHLRTAEQANALTVEPKNRTEDQQRLVNRFRHNVRFNFLKHLQDYHPMIRDRVRKGERGLAMLNSQRKQEIRNIRIFMGKRRGGSEGAGSTTIEQAPRR